MTYYSQIFTAVINSGAASVFIKIHIKTPMQLIFNFPMLPYRIRKLLQVCKDVITKSRLANGV